MSRIIGMPSTRSGRRTLHTALLSLLCLICTGCAMSPNNNPSFDVTVDEAEQAIQKMWNDPKPLERPVVFVGGYGDPGLSLRSFRERIAPAFDDDRMLFVSLDDAQTYDAARGKLVHAVDQAFGETHGRETIEVDVVGNSLGGVVARYAAMPIDDRRTLRIHRLFTLSAPHLGADTADIELLKKPVLVDSRPGSTFLTRLNESEPVHEYEVIPYVRLGDRWVGQANTAPPGELPYWLPNRPLQLAHLMTYSDPRIHADIMRRLRNEKPFTTPPPTPLPE